MANTKDMVTAGKPKISGALFRAPKGTALPTDAVADLAQTYISLGYISDDGVSNSAKIKTDTIKAWGGDVVLTPQSEKTDTFTFTLIEGLNKDVLTTVHGEANVAGTLDDGIVVKGNSIEHAEYVWVIDMIMRGNALKRIVVPAGTVSDVDDVSYKDSSAVAYKVTINAMPDTDGNTHYEYIKAGA